MAANRRNLRDACRASIRYLKLCRRYGWQRITTGIDETCPVGAEEFVLRRIHKNHFDATLPSPVKRPAFEPSSEDSDGLSVDREIFISAKRLAGCGRQPGKYYIARFAVKELAVGPFHVTIDASSDIDQPAGHAVIPELRIGLKTKPLQRALAESASKRIVYRPLEQ